MTRLMTMKEYMIEEFNQYMEEQGRPVRIVEEKDIPREVPKLVVDNGLTLGRGRSST